MTSANDLEKQLVTHEAVCAERYETFIKRVDRLESLLIKSAGALIAAMFGLLVTILMKGM